MIRFEAAKPPAKSDVPEKKTASAKSEAKAVKDSEVSVGAAEERSEASADLSRQKRKGAAARPSKKK